MKRLGFAALILFMVSGFVSPQAGFADSYANGPTHHGYKPDSTIHTYCWEAGPGQSFRNAADAAMNHLQSATNMTRYLEPSCNVDSDVRFDKQELGGTTRGRTTCLEPMAVMPDNSVCNSYEALLDDDLATYHDRTKTACHEVGHTLGLRHGYPGEPDNLLFDDCMRSGSTPNTANFRYFSAHHIDHINCRCDIP